MPNESIQSWFNHVTKYTCIDSTSSKEWLNDSIKSINQHNIYISDEPKFSDYFIIEIFRELSTSHAKTDVHEIARLWKFIWCWFHSAFKVTRGPDGLKTRTLLFGHSSGFAGKYWLPVSWFLKPKSLTRLLEHLPLMLVLFSDLSRRKEGNFRAITQQWKKQIADKSGKVGQALCAAWEDELKKVYF